MSRSERFRTTKWSLVLAAARGGTDRDSRAALEQLCAAYWYPLYVFARRFGRTHQDALELTQGYFLKLLERDELKRVRKDKGKFRTFLLTSFKHHLSDERKRQGATKRGGGRAFLSIDTEEFARRYHEPTTSQGSPERAYERQWAATVVERAHIRLVREAQGIDRDDRFRLIYGFIGGEGGERSYRSIAEQLGLTEASVKMAVLRLRRRFGDLLRDEIAQTVDATDDVDKELRYLLAIVRDE